MIKDSLKKLCCRSVTAYTTFSQRRGKKVQSSHTRVYDDMVTMVTMTALLDPANGRASYECRGNQSDGALTGACVRTQTPSLQYGI